MKVVVCIGSSCHLKGSREVVEKLQNLINDNNLKDKVTLSGKLLAERDAALEELAAAREALNKIARGPVSVDLPLMAAAALRAMAEEKEC